MLTKDRYKMKTEGIVLCFSVLPPMLQLFKKWITLSIAQLVSPILIRWMGFIWWINSGTQPFEQSSPGDASQSLRE